MQMFTAEAKTLDSIQAAPGGRLVLNHHGQGALKQSVIDGWLRLRLMKGFVYVVKSISADQGAALDVQPTYRTIDRVGADDAEERLQAFVSERKPDRLTLLNSAMA